MFKSDVNSHKITFVLNSRDFINVWHKKFSTNPY